MRELLKSLHQRPITFYPIYAKLTGSVSAGVVLSQLMYWFGVCEGDKFYKTDTEIQEETLLSEKQFRVVKEKLKELKFLTISREGLPARTYYQIDWEIYENELKKASKLDTPKRAELDTPKRAEQKQPKRAELDTPKRDNPYNRNNLLHAEITTEMTTKITTENSTPLPPVQVLPDFLDPVLWEQYLDYKKERKEKLSRQGIAMKFSEWAKWHSEGIDVNDCIREAMRNEWQGVFKPKRQNQPNTLSIEDVRRFGGDVEYYKQSIQDSTQAGFIECENVAQIGVRK